MANNSKQFTGSQPAKIALNAKQFTKDQLAMALFDVLEHNSSVADIVHNTCLDGERAEEISKLFADLAKNV
mgnify:CR=1 FL=1